MTKTILAVILAATAFTATAGSNTIVCGNHAVTVQTDANNSLAAIAVDGTTYYAYPSVKHEVEHGELLTFLAAGDPETGRSAMVMAKENGQVRASLYLNKTEWIANCRDAH